MEGMRERERERRNEGEREGEGGKESAFIPLCGT